MLELKKGKDILSEVGKITSIKEARGLIAKQLDKKNQNKLAMIKTEDAIIKIANAISMCTPDYVFIDTGSSEDIQFIREYALERGEEKKLAIDGHTIHFDLPEDQGRMVSQTLYIVNPDEKISSLAKKEVRETSLQHIEKHMTGIMTGKTMFVGFFSRGPVGAEASTPAIEISSSAYVFHSAEILYRNCFADFDKEVKRRGLFFTNVHSEGTNTSEDIPNARIYMDRSWLTTYSMLCTYAGNTLLMKKGNHRFAVDVAVYMKNGLELSEHMFITGMTGPNGRKTYFAGAAPSGCGKTTTAMVGTDFIGDDLAQLWIEKDGTCRAINPEKGIFGIVEDVNQEGDPFLMNCLREPGTEVIFSNVLLDENNKPRWVGDGEPMASKGINYQGEWTPDSKKVDGSSIAPSHANSRCTLLAEAIPNHNKKVNADPKGAEISVVTYSGRDADTMPPVWVAKSMDDGVVIGASIVSKATATEVGATGINRQPWANAPFIPGSLAEYMDAQFKFFNNPKLKKKPVMSGLNYFLTHDNRGSSGKGLIGEKKDVKVWLGWLELYSHGDVSSIQTPIGFIPKYEDLKKLFVGIGKDYSQETYTMQFSLYIDKIISRIDLQTEAYNKEENIPVKLYEVYEKQKEELLALKAKKGAIVKPQDL
ncbi:MAG: phosphoenolpyruvate carboxykinase (GTP) [Candidatus Margulisbacteria bacterium]|nr:phosphoenolpyruvate carboxykinase (GTP) [Candidatus Margulisiibacteriota bacterium]